MGNCLASFGGMLSAVWTQKIQWCAWRICLGCRMPQSPPRDVGLYPLGLDVCLYRGKLKWNEIDNISISHWWNIMFPHFCKKEKSSTNCCSRSHYVRGLKSRKFTKEVVYIYCWNLINYIYFYRILKSKIIIQHWSAELEKVLLELTSYHYTKTWPTEACKQPAQDFDEA